MPELPEVETVRRGLAPAMVGQVIVRADVNRPDLRWPFPPDMAARLTGARVLGLRRRSKYLLADLSDGQTLIVHLGMSGRMQIEGERAPGVFHHAAPRLTQHDHVVLHLGSGSRIVFNDPRRFGAMDLVATDGVDSHRLLAALGPEPLGNAFHGPHLVAACRGRAAPIKAILLDQRIVAGLGNIYVCEALHRARIDPRRAGGRIGPARLHALVPIIRDTLTAAIGAGGSSLRDHRQADGALGYFQHTFRAYDREGSPCVTPGCDGTVRRIVQSGRSTYFCGRCQR